MSAIKQPTKQRFWAKLSRRNLFRGTGLAALGGLFGCSRGTTEEAHYRIPIPTIESIGAKPIINCIGTMTALSGSLMLPEVKAAMMEASKHYIPMDELMDCVGQRLHELTGAEFGAIFPGCNASMVGATAACVAGADPEKMALLPDTTGMKNKVLVSSDQRFVYDRAYWLTGIEMVEVDSPAMMEAAINDRTAMIAIWGEVLQDSRIKLEDAVNIGRKYGVPVMVDAAAERPDVPNVYIEGGADLVAYSGGKCLRGPQAGGILLGRRDLCKAAFLNMSPHHAFGRPMKCGKEEIMGCLAALDVWINGRDHDAEWAEWEYRLNYISEKVTQLPSVTTEMHMPSRPSNYAPSMSISWDEDTIKISPDQVSEELDKGEPRIAMNGGRGGMRIMSYMTEEGEEVPIANRLYEILSQHA